MFILKDGTGTNSLARVDSNNDLHVRSTDVNFALSKAIAGNGVIISTSQLNVTTTAGRVVWIYLNDTVNSLGIDFLSISWNGGSTNFNRPLYISFHAGDTQPTTNISSITARNTNFSKSNVPNIAVLGWDGVGTGMTGYSPGITLSEVIVRQGYTRIELKGNVIIGPKTSLSVGFEGGEDGIATISGFFYLLDPNIDIE